MAHTETKYYYVEDTEDWDIVFQRMCLVTACGCLEELALLLGVSRHCLRGARARLRFRETWLERAAGYSGSEVLWLKTGRGEWRVMDWARS